VDPGVSAGPDTVVEPGVQLLGSTRIGARCTIRTGSVLQNVRVDDDAVIGAHSILDSARVGTKAQIGPFSRLRPGTDVRAGAHVGSFVEMKNTVLREGSKAPHLSYLGDASIGRDTNIGAGTITCNYDGVAKHPTTIGSRVFIGSDTALVAPVRIGDGAYVAAGSVITENVPADALGIARGRQANKRGWAAARRKEIQRTAKSKSSPSTRKSSRRAAKSRSRAKSHPSSKRSRR
jgi:bifunctional UDP-N-acetylglucosamine pyrophosphorylase/glucosamine-1-phosphate N-acetyltransferase